MSGVRSLPPYLFFIIKNELGFCFISSRGGGGGWVLLPRLTALNLPFTIKNSPYDFGAKHHSRLVLKEILVDIHKENQIELVLF